VLYENKNSKGFPKIKAFEEIQPEELNPGFDY